MQEPTRHRLPLRRHPGSLALLALLLSAAAALCLVPYELRRHHKTSDDDIEVIHVFEGKALFQYRFPKVDGTRDYQLDLAQARRGEEPEEANAIGDVLECDLIKEIDQGCWVQLKTGRKLLLTGYPPPDKLNQTFDELIKYTETRETLYWLIDDKNTVKARTLEELAKAVPELKPALGSVKLLKAPDFFDHLAKETDKADSEKAATPQAGSK
jgi:hypothetical protein